MQEFCQKRQQTSISIRKSKPRFKKDTLVKYLKAISFESQIKSYPFGIGIAKFISLETASAQSLPPPDSLLCQDMLWTSPYLRVQTKPGRQQGIFFAEGRTRTGTSEIGQRILSPLRLPNSATPALKRRHPDSNRGIEVLQTSALATWLCRPK